MFATSHRPFACGGTIGGTSGRNSVPADGCTREIRPILAVLSRRDGAVTPVELHGKERVNGSSPLEGFFSGVAEAEAHVTAAPSRPC